MVGRLSHRFRRYCKFLSHPRSQSNSHSRRESAATEAESNAGEEGINSTEQLTGTGRRRSSSIGSAGSRLKMRIRRCTSSPD
ncbi:hypothetical protein KR009_011280 [Drosophila setifemur]|nr:hypothetical protein KR009_011280 [Drosophila setifemur]